LRGLAVTSRQRVEGLADVPTFVEAGLPGVDVSLWFAVLVPSATPQPIVQRLHADIAKVVASPEYKAELRKRGFDAVASAPDDMAAFLDKDYLKFRALIQKLGLQVD
jgi:tripartite-type tricarboxylate transporter receptor subunit TctC